MELIDDLKDSEGASAQIELRKLLEQENTIATLVKRIKDIKAEHKVLSGELEHKLLLKRLGGGEFKVESEQLLKEVDR